MWLVGLFAQHDISYIAPHSAVFTDMSFPIVMLMCVLASEAMRLGLGWGSGGIIGSIFVLTIVMGDFVTIGVMGGQQIASVGKIIQVQTSYLQFPLAAANAVILLAVVLMIIWGLTRLVDIRKEL